MKILVVCQYYYPEPFRINDICEELVKRGNEVVVVTGEPNYPEGKIYAGYEGHKKTDEVINGVAVHRCPIIPRKSGVFYRFLNYLSYPFFAKKYVRNLDASDGMPFDVVFVYQLSPVMMAKPAMTYKKKFGTPIVMYCLDLWPESLIAGGLKRSSAVYKLFYGVSKRIYKRMDYTLVTSRRFCTYLKEEFGIDDKFIDYLPQYAEDVFGKVPYSEPSEIINAVFAGNIGAVQSVETIIEAAEKLQNEPVLFHIVGGGTDLARLQGIVKTKKIKNVKFYGRLSIDEMPDIYNKADVMIVTLKSDVVLSRTLPGKVQSYMAAGKPIIGAIDGEAACVIKEAKCGLCGPAEDGSILARNIKEFMLCGEKQELGKNARRYYEEHFEKGKFIDRLEIELKRRGSIETA